MTTTGRPVKYPKNDVYRWVSTQERRDHSYGPDKDWWVSAEAAKEAVAAEEEAAAKKAAAKKVGERLIYSEFNVVATPNKGGITAMAKNKSGIGPIKEGRQPKPPKKPPKKPPPPKKSSR